MLRFTDFSAHNGSLMRHTILIASILALLCCAHTANAVTQYSLLDLGTLIGPIGDSAPPP